MVRKKKPARKKHARPRETLASLRHNQLLASFDAVDRQVKHIRKMLDMPSQRTVPMHGDSDEIIARLYAIETKVAQLQRHLGVSQESCYDE